MLFYTLLDFHWESEILHWNFTCESETRVRMANDDDDVTRFRVRLFNVSATNLVTSKLFVFMCFSCVFIHSLFSQF